MLLFVFGCKGKKKNLIRQIFFRFQKNILKYAENDDCCRIIFCKKQKVPKRRVVNGAGLPGANSRNFS